MKYNKTLAALTVLFTLAVWSGRGENKTILPVSGSADSMSFCITAYQPSGSPVNYETWLFSDSRYQGYDRNESMAALWRECSGVADTTCTLALNGRFELGKEWLCIGFPRARRKYDEGFAGLRIGRGTTVSRLKKEIGALTVLDGAKGDFDIGFMDLMPEDFRLLEPEAVQNRAECRRINDLIEEAIRYGEVTSLGFPGDTLRMRSLTSVTIEERRLLKANYYYTSPRDGYLEHEYSFIIENDHVSSLTLWRGSFLTSDIHIFSLHDDYYLVYIEDNIYESNIFVRLLDPGTASRDKTVFSTSITD